LRVGETLFVDVDRMHEGSRSHKGIDKVPADEPGRSGHHNGLLVEVTRTPRLSNTPADGRRLLKSCNDATLHQSHAPTPALCSGLSILHDLIVPLSRPLLHPRGAAHRHVKSPRNGLPNRRRLLSGT
jgi:hypothetical protein